MPSATWRRSTGHSCRPWPTRMRARWPDRAGMRQKRPSGRGGWASSVRHWPSACKGPACAWRWAARWKSAASMPPCRRPQRRCSTARSMRCSCTTRGPRRKFGPETCATCPWPCFTALPPSRCASNWRRTTWRSCANRKATPRSASGCAASAPAPPRPHLPQTCLTTRRRARGVGTTLNSPTLPACRRPSPASARSTWPSC